MTQHITCEKRDNLTLLNGSFIVTSQYTQHVEQQASYTIGINSCTGHK